MTLSSFWYAFLEIFDTYGVSNQFLEAIGTGTQQILFTDLQRTIFIIQDA